MIGDEDAAEATFEAERYDEVFVIAAARRRRDRWLIDDRATRARTLARLTRALARSRTSRSRLGAIGDENTTAATATPARSSPPAEQSS